jgi:hypothetical protein
MSAPGSAQFVFEIGAAILAALIILYLLVLRQLRSRLLRIRNSEILSAAPLEPEDPPTPQIIHLYVPLTTTVINYEEEKLHELRVS